MEGCNKSILPSIMQIVLTLYWHNAFKTCEQDEEKKDGQIDDQLTVSCRKTTYLLGKYKFWDIHL